MGGGCGSAGGGYAVVVAFQVPSSPFRSLLTTTTKQRQQLFSHSQGDQIDNKKVDTLAGTTTTLDDSFILQEFISASECDDSNLPPSLHILTKSIQQLAPENDHGSSSDIRGRFLNHPRQGSPSTIARTIRQHDQQQQLQEGSSSSGGNIPVLTPLAAHCIGYAYASLLKSSLILQADDDNDVGPIKIVLGRDPRLHGIVLADSFARGAESVKGVQVVYTGIATTPSMASHCRSSSSSSVSDQENQKQQQQQLCHGAVIVTASHLPDDRNGFKFFTNQRLTSFQPQIQIQDMIRLAKARATYWYDQGIIPPTSGQDALFCSGGWVDYMKHYKHTLKQALIREVTGQEDVKDTTHPQYSNLLKGLKIVLNSGNGSGGFFLSVLEDLGADVSGSIHITPDGRFRNGVPNPEKKSMIQDTIHACQVVDADLGIMLDTDADRCGLVAPTLSQMQSSSSSSQYEAIHRNKLIALMGVIFAHDSPGCAIVTCSVTSQGLAKFLTQDLGLSHVRYLKGYANVIQKAKTLTESGQANAQVAIETSGHCAMKENDYLDDGTYTAVKVIGLLAREKAKDPSFSLPHLIKDLQEMNEIVEMRMSPLDGTMESTTRIFDIIAKEIEDRCHQDIFVDWTLDVDNLEGIRVTVGDDGSFFMLRKSLHDPVLCLQIEADSKLDAKRMIVDPILSIIQRTSSSSLSEDKKVPPPLGLEYQALQDYAQ